MTNKPSNPNITRQDVATRAGVSTAVVSYVVNNGPRRVAPATKQKVLSAIEQLKYRANSHARALAGGKTGIVGLVVPDITNTFFSQLAAALQSELWSIGSTVLIANSGEKPSGETGAVAAMRDRDVDALILVAVNQTTERTIQDQFNRTVIRLDRAAANAAGWSVTIDNIRAAQHATNHLLHHGRKRIGMIAGPAELAVSVQREEGYSTALADFNAKNESVIVRSAFSKQGGFEAFNRLMALPHPVDAILVASEEQALGVYGAAYLHKLLIPEDIAVVAFDGTEGAEYSAPSLSAITQPIPEMAAAVKLILERTVIGPPEDIVCDFGFAVRRSCGCPA